MILDLTSDESSALAETLRREDELGVWLKTFPRLIELGHEIILVTYVGSGDSGDEFKVKVEGVMTEDERGEVDKVLAEEMKVCQIRCQYQPTKHKWEYTAFSNTKTADIIILDAVMNRVSSEFGGWELNEGSHGTAFINLNTGKVLIEHTWHTETQESEQYILTDSDLVDRKDKFFTLMPKEEGTVCVRYNREEDYLWIDGVDVTGKKRKVIERLAKAIESRTRRFWEDKNSPEFLIKLDRYSEHIVCWIESKCTGEDTVRHSFWFAQSFRFAESNEMNERNTEHDGEE